MTCRDAQPFLGAYLDGELDLVRSLEVEAHVESCEACARELRGQEDVSAAVSGAPRFPASSQLRRRLGHVGQRHALPGRWATHGAALLVAGLVVAGLLLWRFLPARPQAVDLLVEQAVHDHVRSLQANHLLDVASSQPIQSWFGGKLDYSPAVESMPWRGFELAGGRLDYLGGRAVAALVYQRGPHIVNVFVWPASGQPDRAPHSRAAEGFHVTSWQAYGMDWWAVSDLGPAELEELAVCPCFMPPNRTLRADAGVRPRLD
jgi:anti-sigma factor RsiW